MSGVAKRQKGLTTSTPVTADARREVNLIASPASPVDCDQSSINTVSDQRSYGPQSPTGISGDIDSCRVTPTRRVETSDDVVAGINALWEAGLKSNAFSRSLPVDLNNYDQHDERNVHGRDSSDVLQLVNALVDGLNINEWSSGFSIEPLDTLQVEREQDQVVEALQQEAAVGEVLLQAVVANAEQFHEGVAGEVLLQSENRGAAEVVVLLQSENGGAAEEALLHFENRGEVAPHIDDAAVEEVNQLGAVAEVDGALHIGDLGAINDGGSASDASCEISFYRNMDPAWIEDYPMYLELPCKGLVRNAGSPNFSDASITIYEEEVAAFLTETRGGSGGENVATVSGVSFPPDEEKPKTPRRRLSFGANLTPELASSRATPGATPTKRSQETLDGGQEDDERKKRKLSLTEKVKVKGIQQLDTLTGSNTTVKPTVVERLKHEKTSGRSKSTPRRGPRRQRILSTPTPGQRKITDMMGNSPVPNTIKKKEEVAINFVGARVENLKDCKNGGSGKLSGQPDLGSEKVSKK